MNIGVEITHGTGPEIGRVTVDGVPLEMSPDGTHAMLGIRALPFDGVDGLLRFVCSVLESEEIL
jgi:hypothetical protein